MIINSGACDNCLAELLNLKTEREIEFKKFIQGADYLHCTNPWKYIQLKKRTEKSKKHSAKTQTLNKRK